jgi:[ribosomal protein S5]-alanine N-acetyltransferase
MTKEYFLENSLIYLRKIEKSDLNKNYYDWLNDSSTIKFMEIRKFPNSISDIEEYIMESSESNSIIMFAICLKESSKHIGNIKLWQIDWINKNAMISILIGDQECRGMGIAKESISLICDYAFNILNMHKLRAGIHEENIASLKVFKSNDFVQEGLLLDQIFFEGSWSNQYLLGKVNNN